MSHLRPAPVVMFILGLMMGVAVLIIVMSVLGVL
jgi:ABC-type lipoprotein release transport system permease subunit